MTKLRPLVEKEVKDLLRDPRVYIGLVVPIIMLPLISLVMSISMRTSLEVATRDLRVALMDLDETEVSGNFESILANLGLKVENINVGTLEAAIGEARSLGCKALLVIPRDFGEDLMDFRRVRVELYAIIDSVGIGSMGLYSAVDAALEGSSKLLSDMLISRLNPNLEAEALREPLDIIRSSVVKDTVIHAPPEAMFGQLVMGYSVLIPMILFILATTLTQLAATATAVENEEKTLETLLTFPVTRYSILMAKLLGSSLVAVLGAVLFTLGFLLYFQGMFTLPGMEDVMGGLFQAIQPPPPESYILLAVSLTLAILFVTSLGIAIGALSSDVRMSNSLLGVVTVPVMIPSFLVMYGELRTLPLALQLLIYALPTSYPMVLAKEMATSTVPIETIYGIPYSAALTFMVLYATSELLAPEKLLTLQYKLSLKRGRKGTSLIEFG